MFYVLELLTAQRGFKHKNEIFDFAFLNIPRGQRLKNAAAKLALKY
jgi:hypothetical protein